MESQDESSLIPELHELLPNFKCVRNIPLLHKALGISVTAAELNLAV
jgi:hypothetical protein